MSNYNSFLLFWPNSDVKYNTATKILDFWGCEYLVTPINIPNSIAFFQKLYGLNRDLAKNKLWNCGSGKAILIEYNSPLDIERYRATYTDTKISNVFCYDLKRLLRSLEGKNRIHGSTDFNEYFEDMQKFEKIANLDVCYGKDYTHLEYYSYKFKSILSKISLLFKNRIKYTKQLIIKNFDYLYCKLKFRNKLKFIMRNKWRWGSRYFISDLNNKNGSYFIKTPNHFENAELESNITNYLYNLSLVPSEAELISVFGKESIQFKYLNIINPSAEYFATEDGVYHLVTLLNSLRLNGVIHRDLKLDNIILSDDTLQVIDLGLARKINNSELILSVKSIGSVSERCCDGFEVFDMVIKYNKESIFYNKELYVSLASSIGVVVYVNEKYYAIC